MSEPYYQPNRKFHWNIWYEIPPTRGIRTASAKDCTHDELQEALQYYYPKWKVVKIETIPINPIIPSILSSDAPFGSDDR